VTARSPGSAGDDRRVVATKGGWGAGKGPPRGARAQIEESLRRLRSDSIALYYLHRVDPDTPLEGSLATIKEYCDGGKIRHVEALAGRAFRRSATPRGARGAGRRLWEL
jgi:aryl-alcohol dehydrogenase-like predicted oxidoreductase